MPRNALFASIICVLALVAAVVSLVQGRWLGLIWILMAWLSSATSPGTTCAGPVRRRRSRRRASRTGRTM